MTIVARRRRVAPSLPFAQAVDPEPAECKCEQEENPAPVGDDESDVEPGGLTELGWKVVPALQLVQPLPCKPEQDQAGQTYEKKREVPEA